MVLVFSVALALVVGALATYASSTLTLGQAAERSSDRLASANGAMDSALEDLERGVGPCLLFGQDYTLTDSVNDLSPDVDCDWVGGRFNVGDLFAVVMTGAGGQTGPLLNVTNGGTSANAEKVFEGPVYMAGRPTTGGTDPTMDFSATLSVKNADLSYSSSECGSVGPSLPTLLSIIPVGYGTQCYSESWDGANMFGGFFPAEPGVNGTAYPLQSSTPPPADDYGCHVWPAGEYRTPPQLDNRSYNYFESGDYYFNDFGNWSISSAFVLFGYPGDTGPSIDGFSPSDTLANNPCSSAWGIDANAPATAQYSGATIYMGGNSQLSVDENSTLEISGRERSGQNIAVHALETNGGGRNPSTIRGDQRIITTGPGSNKQLSIQGLVWAPDAALEFDLISNDAVAALTGGAVVSELVAGASANANNFLIRVATKPADKLLNLTTTANSPNGRGSTSVRSVIRVQRDEGATSYAVESRRIVGLTPEGLPLASPTTTTTTTPTTTTTAPPPATGPCNVIAGDWTRDFGDGGWSAEYWNLTSTMTASPTDPFSGAPTHTENVSQIYKLDEASAPASGVNADFYAARFTKSFELATACDVKLESGSDDGVRVKVNGTAVIADWTDHSYEVTNVSNVPLVAGANTIVFEFYQRAGESGYSLSWRD